jgi:hypothetical protein
LWGGFCDEKKGRCGKCGDCEKNGGCGKCGDKGCKKHCCRGPRKYRQDLFTHLRNHRASKQADCGCEESCDECGHSHDHGNGQMTPEESIPVAPPAEDVPPANAAPSPSDANHPVIGPANERAAMRKTPRRSLFPIGFGTN